MPPFCLDLLAASIINACSTQLPATFSGASRSNDTSDSAADPVRWQSSSRRDRITGLRQVGIEQRIRRTTAMARKLARDGISLHVARGKRPCPTVTPDRLAFIIKSSSSSAMQIYQVINYLSTCVPLSPKGPSFPDPLFLLMLLIYSAHLRDPSESREIRSDLWHPLPSPIFRIT